MEANLEKLLKRCQLKSDNYPFFENGKLIKIIGNKEKTKYLFRLELTTNLPVDVYTELLELLKKEFNFCEKIILEIIAKNIDLNIINDYFKYTINKYKKNNPLLEMFVDSKIELIGNKLKININNRAEAMKLDSIKAQLLKDLNYYGYKIDNFDYQISQEDSQKIREEIANEMNKYNNIEVKEVAKPKNNYKAKTSEGAILGRIIQEEAIKIKTLIGPVNSATIEACIFEIDIRETKTQLKIVTLKVTDYTDSIYCKLFVNDEEEFTRLSGLLKKGKWYKIRGNVKDDPYSNELVISAYDINPTDHVEEVIMDNAKEKRVELHAHTKMSQMDGVVESKDLLKQALKWGHKAIAITDHNGLQAFPDVYTFVRDYNKEHEEPFKAIYGVELTMVDDDIDIVVRPNESKLLENTYVVFDFETTGLNAGGKDSIIEVGAVKIFNGEIIDRFSKLIDPKVKLSEKITEITHITDEILKGKPSEEEVIKEFIDWFGDLPMVAHNAKFDVSFLEMAYKKYNFGTFKNTVIDTLELSRTMDNNYARHSLSALVKRYNVPFDEDAHHRADYDAEGTAYVFHKMLLKLNDRNFETIKDIDSLVTKDEIHKYGRTFHINILAKTKPGLKNLFKIVSFANTKYLYKTPRILKSVVNELREGLLIGSGCYESEVFVQARSKGDEELTNIINFYDYVEVQPLDCYNHLIQSGDFENQALLMEHIKKIIKNTESAGKLIVATGDVHHLTKDDKIYREIIVNQKVPGGGRHPLARNNIKEIPSCHFRTTDEMFSDFDFLDEETRYKIIVENPNKIADMVDILEVIVETGGVPFSPKIENCSQIVTDMVYNKAHEIYGDPLPQLIQTRTEQELKGIIDGGFDVVYLLSQRLVKKSNEDGYLVGSRGSVGSSFVATMMGITEVNPLPAHYVCPNCKHSIFELDGKALGKEYSSGYDLPNMNCPKCQTLMKKEGQDMPFATFLGFNADKVPDIDLNFSGDYQWRAHEYTKELLGVDNVYRAGTIGTVAKKTAFGFVKGYCEDKGIKMRTAEVERLALGCEGVKRTTGQHPGGIVVVPDYMEIYDFTPYQYPADDVNSLWKTTHFDYHKIEDDLLKLDILGHDVPTILRMLEDLSGVDVTTLPMDDPKIFSLLTSPDELKVTKEQIMCPTGTLGLPELGTKFTLALLEETKPKTFGELVKISGLSHGTDVWAGNAQELIKNKIVPFKDVIGCRDEIMVYLMNQGMEPLDSFKIMEFVRKGKATKLPEQWPKWEQKMKDANIPDWYIESCHKIKYMFPKAHAVAYVMSALRIAWFKLYKPIMYYATHFSIKVFDFDIKAMIDGYDAIKERIIEIENKGFEASNKESSILEGLQIALEASARGFKFASIDLNKSDSDKFLIAEDGKTLIPPFRAIEGLGETVAKKIVEEREKNYFLSIEDLQKRAKVSSTLIEKMKMMGILDGMDESSQISIFSFDGVM